MEISKNIQIPEYLLVKSSTQTPCQRYGLDISKLQIDQLFQYRQYRRLYNIVLNDQTANTSYNFRPQLIKQLYFLLQITPFIEPDLQQSYLASIEQWYNSNDYKKVQLSKNLNGMLSNVMKNKTKNLIGRPKSSVSWDKNLNCFLRPYTAKLQRNQRKQKNANNEKFESRPETSKNTFNKSTCADTNIFAQQVELQGQYDETIGDKFEDLCDIEQQWERSRDFINKHRTIHPQEQPTYQKLMRIIKKADNGQFNQFQFFGNKLKKNQSTIGVSGNKFDIKKRNIYSATIKRQNTKIAVREQLAENKDAVEQENNNSSNEVQQQQQDDNTLSEVQVNVKNKIFNSDKRSKNIVNKSLNRLYTRVNGLRIVRPFTSKQNNIVSKLDNYHNIQNNKRVISTLQDQQFKQKTIDYIRNKGVSRKELARRTQAKRLINNLMQNNKIKIIPSKKKNNLVINNKKQNKLNQGNRQDQTSENMKTIRMYSEQDKQNSLKKSRPAYYSVKRLFKDKNRTIMCKQINKIRQKHKILQKQTTQDQQLASNKNFYMSHPLSSLTQQQIYRQKQCMDLTKNQQITTQYRFDPGHPLNIVQYNQQALNDIQKIKQKISTNCKTGDNVYVNTQTLMRALYVDPGPYQIENIDDYLKKTADQKIAQIQEQGKENKKLQIYDPKYMMFSKGEKKKTKKKSKLGKSKSLKPRK